MISMGNWGPEEEKQARLAELARKYGLAPEKEPVDVIRNRGDVILSEGAHLERKREEQRAREAVTAAEAAPGPKVTKVTRGENELLLALMVLRNQLVKYSPDIRQRCRDAGRWTWRDLRLMLAMIDRVQAALWPTLPERRKEYYDAYVRNGRYEMHIDRPVRVAHHVMIRDTLLAALCEGVMETECLLCTKEGRDVERCLIREALMEAAPPSGYRGESSRWDACEYMEPARQLTRGEEVKV